jgi:1-acyl-sn-glycerol-3-phosphate acyltransferase
MAILKKILAFFIILTYLIIGAILHIVTFWFKPSFRLKLISHWTRLICIFFKKTLGIKLITNVRIPAPKGTFIVSNHLSYLDGIILGSIFPVVFVSKLQVKSWPIFGWVAQLEGTVFVDRERKLKSLDSLEEIAGLLKNSVNILLFAEGTSTNGSQILPFQSIFFQAPLSCSAPILPVTIQYTKVESADLNLSNRDCVFWYGQVNFLKHLLDVLKLRSIEAKVIIHPEIETYSLGLDPRKDLSETTRQTILKAFSPLK